MPGPTQPECIIGCINPTGILGKSSTLASLPKAKHVIWAVSETHLSKPGMTKFDQQLKFFQTGLQAQMGSPVPLRSQTVSAIAGKHRGVGFVCSTPHRAMTATWPSQAWAEGRFHVACFQAGERWIQGGVVYGFASQPHITVTKQQTDRQCQFLTERLLDQSDGLRFIGGDFNQPNAGVPNMEKWLDAGWINVQQWALQTLGKPIEFTCKQKTTVDHLFVSPQLGMYLRNVEIQHDWFADHSVLMAHFADLGSPPKLPMWRKPKPIDWKQVNQDQLQNHFRSPDQTSDSTTFYRNLFDQVEQAVDHSLRAQGKGSLPQQSKGRAKTLEVQWVQEHSAPVRPAREGEHSPSFHGINLQHCRWTRQYRRLVNYTRLVKDFQDNPSRSTHKFQLWTSITKAQGFAPSFLEWIHKETDFQLQSCVQPPDHAEAVLICQAFHGKLIGFEKLLNQSRIQGAKQRRQDDPTVIFRDLRDDMPQPVQMLVDHHQSVITDIDPDEVAVVTQHDVPWKLDRPLQTPDSTIPIIHAEERKVWLESVDSLEVGQTVEQDNYFGTLPDLFAKFQAEWSARWDRHLHVDDNQWDPIIQFAKLALPSPKPMEYAPIQYDEWMATLKSKSKRSATGPDGVSREDLLHLPRKATEDLLQLFADIEAGRPWPRQLVVGVVASLAKVPGAATTNQFRPITVLPVAYRTWGSIRARQILKHLQPFAPASCAGNVPSKQTADIWFQIMCDIEVAQHAQTSLTGGVVDLEKAFNMLPRMPILEFMKILNVAEPVLLAWSTALVALERRFQIHQSMGPPILSSSGFAEGDALSVTAMLAANLVVHQYMVHRYPRTMLWTFVDNWEITGPSASHVSQALEGLHKVCTIMDMKIDAKKSFAWSIQTEERKTLRSGEHQVKLWAKDLGGHVQYSQVVTNCSITERCAKVKPLWGKLARSLAPYHQKIQALRSKAWPACLHGVASVHLGDEHFQRLRTGAVQGIGEHCPGTSPPIHLSLVEKVQTDPQFHAIFSTVSMFRANYHDVDNAVYCLEEIHLPRKTAVPRPGPVAVMLERLHQLGWYWIEGLWFCDHWHRPLHLLTCPIQELGLRLAQGWQQRIQGQCASRKTLQGLQWMSPSLTTPTLKTLEPEKQALLRTCLNGTFFTADRLKHQQKKQGQEENDKCQFCGMPDSQTHRHWDCPFFQDCRALSEDQIATVRSLPPAVHAHGWMPEPPSLSKFQAACLTIPDEHVDFVWPPSLPTQLECFTDGACLAPTSPNGRFAAWGVVIGDPVTLQFHPISNGLVPGWMQTSLRGEIWAVLSSCQFALLTGKQIRVWCDNDLVVKRVLRYQRSSVPVKPNSTNADLWTKLQSLVLRLGPRLSIVKICSHQDLSTACDEGERWIFAGNEAADRLAQNAYLRFPELYTLWERLQSDIESIHILRNKIHTTLLAIAQKAVRHGHSVLDKPDKQLPSRIHSSEVQVVSLAGFADTNFGPRYDCPEGHKIAAWLVQLEDHRQPIRACSWFQLNAVYEYMTGSKGIRHNKSRRKWEDGCNHLKAVDFVARTKSFSKWIQGVAQDRSQFCTPLHLRPDSEVIQFWTMCISVRVKQELVQLMEDVLRNAAPRLKTVKSLRSL